MAGNKLIFKDAEEVRDAITASQQKEIKELYESWADEIAKEANRLSHRNTFSSEVRANQLRELEQQLRNSSQVLSNKLYSKIKNGILTVSESVIRCNYEWLKDLGFSAKGIDAAFSYVPDDVVTKLITGQVYKSGWSLSKRIWYDNEKTMRDIYTVVAKGLAGNKTTYEIAKELERYVRPEKKLSWNYKMSDGVRIYKKAVDYNAQRLARTLVQHGYQQSFVEATKKNPFVVDYIWWANGSRPCPLCSDRNGEHFKKENLPLDHPNGMCTMEPNISDDYIDQLADWFNSPYGTFPEIDEFALSLGFEF